MENVKERAYALHVLWEAGAVTDTYAEARLEELSDLCSRKASVHEPESEEEEERPYLGDRIVELVENRQMDLYSLSASAHIPWPVLSDIFNNRQVPTLDELQYISDALEIDISEFFPPRSKQPT